MKQRGEPPEEEPNVQSSLGGATDNSTTDGAHAGVSAIETSLGPDEVMAKLEKRARQGKLAGFVKLGARRFRVLVFAGVFDHEMAIELRETPSGGARLEPTLTMLRRAPVVAWVGVVLMFVPGLPLTDSMMRAYFRWYDAWSGATWWWYVPMTLLVVPVLLKQIESARAEAQREGEKVLKDIQRALH